MHRANLDGADEPRPLSKPARYALIHAQHRSGSELPLMTRAVILRDSLGARIGSAVIFHLADHIDTLPHGDRSEESDLESAQVEMEEQAESAYEDFFEEDKPLGLMWITVDQAHELRKTREATAWETMIGRIDDEFLVLSLEPTAAALAAHAQMLAGLARTSTIPEVHRRWEQR